MKRSKRYIWGLLLGCVILGGILFYLFFASNTGSFSKKKYLYIKTGSTYEDLLRTIKDSALVKNVSSFNRVGKWFDLPGSVHPGRYEIREGMGNYAMVNMIRKGRQSPVNLVINKLRTKNDIIRKLSSQLEPDSLQWDSLFRSNVFLEKYEVDTFQLQTLVMPNTYQFYWNSKAEQVIEKIARYSIDYWTAERKALASAKGLTPKQVITIASIVEEETNKNDEKPTVASVYINRYKIGMKLGADPTVKFANGDFALKRILNKHTQFPSPYNTYLVGGLPPGPICTPSESSINAVLHATDSKFLFFCAREDFSGYHNFSVSYAEHLANARKYQDALNKRGIR